MSTSTASKIKRLRSFGFRPRAIAADCNVSLSAVNRVLADERQARIREQAAQYRRVRREAELVAFAARLASE